MKESASRIPNPGRAPTFLSEFWPLVFAAIKKEPLPRAPSIVPDEHDQTVYLVADYFKTGSVWREADYEDTELETVIQDLLSGQYNNPIRVVAFNTVEHWSQDVSGAAGVAATCRDEIYRSSFRTLPINTKVDITTFSYRFR